MTDFKIIRLKDSPELTDVFAPWFHENWKIPIDTYIESMNNCINHSSAVPQWYGVMEQSKMIAGLGVIENDFYDRKDLTPNLCAIYVEEKYRCMGIAGKMLNFVCNDMETQGIERLYLVTDHTSFYERYGREYLCIVQSDGEPTMTRIYIHKTFRIFIANIGAQLIVHYNKKHNYAEKPHCCVKYQS